MRRLSSFILMLLLLAGGAAAAPAPPRVEFAFHSAFLLNLHHYLYNLATHPAAVTALPPDQAQALSSAVAFYRDHYAGRDLLFDDSLAAIKRKLLAADDARREPDGLALPPALAAVLRAAAPVYAAHTWLAQDAANRAWITAVQTLDARHGAAVQAAVERGLASRYPAQVRIDVVFETGKRQGAYTDASAVIPSGRAGYGGNAALEMLYHEAAHVQTADALEAALEQALKAAGKPTDSDLWHVLLFYTVGAATHAALARDGIDYLPYADKAGLMRGVWADAQPLIEADWKPYLAGETSLAAALAQMAAAQ
jgi:hypothetical protein